MQITDIIWLPSVVDKLDWKHGVMPDEVEELLVATPHIRRIERGSVQGEDVYAAMGQTEAGRYLIVFFVHKADGTALVLSAREMDDRERRRYGRG